MFYHLNVMHLFGHLFFHGPKFHFALLKLKHERHNERERKKINSKRETTFFPNFRIDFHCQWFQTTLTISYISAQLVFDSFRRIFFAYANKCVTENERASIDQRCRFFGFALHTQWMCGNITHSIHIWSLVMQKCLVICWYILWKAANFNASQNCKKQ